MESDYQFNFRLVPLLSLAIVSMILITSQFPTAFAGVQGGDADPDGDNVFSNDNCPFVYNPGQEDVNDDGIGDACVPTSQLVDEVIVVVEDTLENIDDISPGQINSIVGKLESAADKLDNGQVNGAVGSLNAFINQIEALMNSGKLSDEEGEAFIYAVEMIIEAID